MTAALMERLRRALEQELPSIAFDEDTVEYLANAIQGTEASIDDAVDAWTPFLISYGAASDDDAARDVCCSVLRRLGPISGPPEEAAGADADGAAQTVGDKIRERKKQAESQGEPVSGLSEWLERLKLEQYAEEASRWCNSRGVADAAQLLDTWEDFSDSLSLKPLERRRVKKDAENRSDALAAAAAASEADAAQAAAAAPAQGQQHSRAECGNPQQAADQYEGYHTFGQSDNPYVLLNEIGSGANATVYRCIRKANPAEPFAVKVIDLTRLRLHTDPTRALEKLRRETVILFSLKHLHIVSLFDVIETRERLYLVMELVEGGELFDDIVKNGCLTEPEARYVFMQLADALRYIHSKGIVHRDLKPENILVDRAQSRPGLHEVKISDFGHSKLIDGYSTALTRVGTPQYWAPEVSDAGKCAQGYDETVDLWSLGVVLFVMLEGTYPFDGKDTRGGNWQQQAKIQFPTTRQTSKEARDLISKLIQFEPRRRLQLDECVRHPWVARLGGPMMQVMDVCRKDGAWRLQADEERFKLRVEPRDARRLRRDLHTFTTRFKVSAVLRNGEVVVTWGGPSAPADREATRRELMQLLAGHFASVGEPPPGGGA